MQAWTISVCLMEAARLAGLVATWNAYPFRLAISTVAARVFSFPLALTHLIVCAPFSSHIRSLATIIDASSIRPRQTLLVPPRLYLFIYYFCLL